MKRAIVLAGGGSRGAYELGAWQALDELGESFDGFFGTSIGSLNAALMAQGDLKLAEELWSNITVGQVMTDGINLDFSVESILAQRKELLPFLKQFARNRGADITPLIALTRRVIDERRIRAARVSFGLVTVKFPSLQPVVIRLDQMPEGTLVDYLMASSACFPAFPVYTFGSEGYIDGGYYDNLPISLAINDGAEEITVIDLHVRPIHPQEVGKPYARYIHPVVPLGSTLLFEQEMIQRNRLLGYYDTLRSFGRLRGWLYAIAPVDEAHLMKAARRFALLIARVEAGLHGQSRSAGGTVDFHPLSVLIAQYTGGCPLGYVDWLLRGCEICAECLGVNPMRLYEEQTLHDMMKKEILAANDPEATDGLTIREGEAEAISDCVRVLLERRTYTRGELKKLCARPRELIAAFYMIARSGI